MLAGRWGPAVDGVTAVTAKLDKSIDFGLMLFPDVSSFACTAATLDVPVAPNNGANIGTFLSTAVPTGNTPTPAALKTARKALGSGLTSPDEPAAGKFVLLITDGAPNCGVGGVDDGMVTQSISESVAWPPTACAPTCSATRSTTPPLRPRSPRWPRPAARATRPTATSATRRAWSRSSPEIAGGASCEFQLEEPADDLAYVSVTLDGKAQKLNAADGWKIDAAKLNISLQGAACATFLDGDDHLISIEVACEVVNVL